MSNAFRQIALQKIAESQANSGGGRVPEGWPSRFFYGPDESHFLTMLHDYEMNMPLQTHTYKVGRGRYRTDICNEMFGLACENCNSDDEERSRKSSIFCFLAYVHTLEGLTRTIQSGKREGEEYDVDPFRVVDIRPGKKQANLAELQDAHRGGYFLNNVWQVKKTGTGTDTTYLPPMVVPKEKLGPDFVSKIPDYVKEKLTPPKGLTQEQLIYAMLLAPFGNNEKALELCGVTMSIEDIVEAQESAAKKSTGKPSSKL